jgi:hypothetical protein
LFVETYIPATDLVENKVSVCHMFTFILIILYILWCEGRIQRKIVYIDLVETAEGTGSAVPPGLPGAGGSLDIRQN